MNVTKITFSPTGGTENAADILAQALGNVVSSVDLTEPDRDFSSVTIDNRSIVVIAVPVFGGRVPAPATERLEQIQGNGAKCVVIAVYGNRAYDDALAEVNAVAAKCGFKVIAAVSAVAEHSIARQFATGRPDQQDKDELRGFAVKILDKVSQDDPAAVQSIPGSVPTKEAGGMPMSPSPGKNCVSCGLCAKKCPVGAISRSDPKDVDGKKCISCMRCIAVCPKEARKLNSTMLAGVGMALKKACAVRKGNELFL